MQKCDVTILKSFYHAILKYEAAKICGASSAFDVVGKLCSVVNPQHYITKDELFSIASQLGLQGKEAEICIDTLVNRGFLVKLGTGNTDGDKYRSYHFDLFLHVSDLRFAPWTDRMTTQTVFTLGEQVIEDFTIASLKPSDSENSIEEEKELWNILRKELGSFAEIYINVLEKYLQLRGSKGLTYFQLYSILQALKNYHNMKVIAIGAPAGSGKTEIFLSLALFKILKDLNEGRKSRILIIYPRKFLEVDQAQRIIEFVKILNEELTTKSQKKVTVAIRDGDTYELEKLWEEQKNVDLEFRGIKCKDGALYIEASTGLIVCKNAVNPSLKQVYDFVKWRRDESKNADIIITNLYTFFNRIITSKSHDLNAIDLLKHIPIGMIVLDEAHEYEPLELGLLHYIFKFFEYLRKTKDYAHLDIKLIISTATLLNMHEFAKNLRVAHDNEVLVITYSDVMQQLKSRLITLEQLGKTSTTKKLLILGVTFVHPSYSWETFTSQLAIVSLYTNFALEQSLGKSAIKQAIVFLNNVRELNRLFTIIENDLQLGSPFANAGLGDRYSSLDLDPIRYRHSLKHYTELLNKVAAKDKTFAEILRNIIAKGNAKEELYSKLAKVYADVNLQDRRVIAEKIKSKELYTIISTSSLELGVDYPGVSIVVNVGLDKLPSLIQRFGRAGRSIDETLHVALALIIARNNPLEYVKAFRLLEQGFNAIASGDLNNITSDRLRKELEVNVGHDLIGVKKIAVTRVLFMLNALRSLKGDWKERKEAEELDPFTQVRNEEKECEKLIKLRKYLVSNEGVIKEIVDESAVEAILREILRYDSLDACISERKHVREIEDKVLALESKLQMLLNACNDLRKKSETVNNTPLYARLQQIYDLCNKIYGDSIAKLDELKNSISLLVDTKSIMKSIDELSAKVDEEKGKLCKKILEITREPYCTKDFSLCFKIMRSVIDLCEES